jgi:4-amino-4-deoxy-L-arabinose transferase-like glycosyltransferase
VTDTRVQPAAKDQGFGLTILAIVAAITLARLVFIGLDRYDLSGDEAQYWVWSLSPALGYYSKPPLVAWIIAASTAIFGDATFGVRMASPIAHGLTALLLYASGKRLYGTTVGLWSAILYATLPAVFVSSLLISTDPFLLVFWAAALYASIRLIESNDDRWWIALGLILGVGSLAKYAMAMFPIGLALFFALSPDERRKLSWRGPTLALILAFLLYLPNLVWNLEHGLVSYRHTADNANLAGALVQPFKGVEFLLAQFGVFGPIPFALLIAALARPKPLIADWRSRLLVSVLAPLGLMMIVVAFLSRANANWAAPLYVSATVLVAAWAIERGRARLLGVAVAIHLVAAGLMAGYHDLARLAGIELSSSTDPFKRLLGWRPLGSDVGRALGRHPGAVLLMEDRMDLATMIYWARPQAWAKWNPSGRIRDHWDLTADLLHQPDASFLLVTPNPKPDDITQRFAKATPLGLAGGKVYRDLDRTHHLFLLEGFRGYER